MFILMVFIEGNTNYNPADYVTLRTQDQWQRVVLTTSTG